MQTQAIVGVLALAGVASAAPVSYEAEPDQVIATYEVSVGRSRISGVSRTLQWTIGQGANGDAAVRLEMTVDSFDSDHPEVDAAIRRAMAAARFPTVRIEGIARDAKLVGTITMHGVSRPLTATLVQSRVENKLLLRTSLSLSFRAFGVTPPPQMGDAVDVTVLALLSVRPEAVLSGGIATPAGLQTQ